MQRIKSTGSTEKKCVQNCEKKSSKGREYITETDGAKGKILEF
jgi:hypothetical protein